ncbi:aspartoacylase [Endozoicomonas sp. SCSIO W0465]|uniref:aspartoacylase n=1 Tax=Endozoicomonas sp. SCSIO W0465 TaxID=2918516 RepID=UPI0020759F59|nr:aspartoacylase [Endozoicomonas sp. SCSIO W0465]USE37879.1 aspartoacylase [Endozoicomonas sp. SCSIO W0465]
MMKGDKNQIIEKVTIIGGTHGNEYIGPYFIAKVEKLGIYQNNAIEVATLLANPEAFCQARRFIDQDLNRSFSPHILTGTQKPYECQRAREIARHFSQNEPDQHFIIDLHSTTANMGITLIVRNNEPLNLRTAAYVQKNIPEARILLSDKDNAQDLQHRSLSSISRFGIVIEVGPLPNAVIRHDLFEATEKVVALAVKFLTLSKTREEPKLPGEVTVFKPREKAPYPRDAEGELTAMVHRDLQDRDYRLLEASHPVFMTFQGVEIQYAGERGYPVFINEAAYYLEDTAFIITDKVAVSLKYPPTSGSTQIADHLAADWRPTTNPHTYLNTSEKTS